LTKIKASAPLLLLKARESSQELRQLGDVGGDAPGLVASEQLCRRARAGLILEIDVGQLAGVILHDEAGVGFLDEDQDGER
jgi:hypothetical protein